MAGHTGGKWTAAASGDGKETAVYGRSKKLHEPVCVIPHDDVTDEGYDEVDANKRLILAAPALLKLLAEVAENAREIEHDSYLLQGHEFFDPRAWSKKAVALVKKVKGGP